MSAPKYHGFEGSGDYCTHLNRTNGPNGTVSFTCGYMRDAHPDIKGELSDIAASITMTFTEWKAMYEEAEITKAVREANLIALMDTHLGLVIVLLKAHTLTEQRWCGSCKRFAIGQAEHIVQVLSENGYRITQSE